MGEKQRVHLSLTHKIKQVENTHTQTHDTAAESSQRQAAAAVAPANNYGLFVQCFRSRSSFRRRRRPYP